MNAIDGYKTKLSAAGAILAAILIWALHIWGVPAWGISDDIADKLPSIDAATGLFWFGLTAFGIRSALDKLGAKP